MNPIWENYSEKLYDHLFGFYQNRVVTKTECLENPSKYGRIFKRSAWLMTRYYIITGYVLMKFAWLIFPKSVRLMARKTFGCVSQDFLTSKPMSNIRSASSRHKNRQNSSPTFPRSRKSTRRPGVATSRWHPRCKLRICSPTSAPP